MLGHTSWWVLVSLPLISALIGWGTNRLAIRMLFHPRKPINFGLFKLQGLIPRRHAEIAERTGEIVARELVSGHALRNEIEKIDLGPLLNQSVHKLVRNQLGPRLQTIPFLGSMVNEGMLVKLEGMACEAMEAEAPSINASVAAMAEEKINIQKLVQERVDAFELNKLEEVVWNLASREFRQIELLGAILGFLIGIIQLGLVMSLT
jgi:uncharacterized membrane protein YheB (UPF0754 family)